MIIEDFNILVDYIVEERIKKVMCNKSAEYARGDDKLHNFKRAGEIDGISSIEALRGMQLKHTTSIKDMLDDIKKGEQPSTCALWEEKLTDEMNYTILLWALLAETYGWILPSIELKRAV